MGSGLGKLWASKGHHILFSFSRDPKKLTDLAKSIPNAKSGSPADAVASSDILLFSVGYGMIKTPDLPIVGSQTITTIPVGVGLSFDPPLFPLKPRIAPRMEFQSVSGGGSSTSSFRVSGGVNFNLLLGLGVHAAVDWGQKTVSGATVTPLILSVGAHFNFHVPM